MNEGVLTVGCEVGYPPFEDFAYEGTPEEIFEHPKVERTQNFLKTILK